MNSGKKEITEGIEQNQERIRSFGEMEIYWRILEVETIKQTKMKKFRK